MNAAAAIQVRSYQPQTFPSVLAYSQSLTSHPFACSLGICESKEWACNERSSRFVAPPPRASAWRSSAQLQPACSPCVSATHSKPNNTYYVKLTPNVANPACMRQFGGLRKIARACGCPSALPRRRPLPPAPAPPVPRLSPRGGLVDRSARRCLSPMGGYSWLGPLFLRSW